MKTATENYTGVCHYCGRLFQSNRSTARFCCPAHRSLFGRYGGRLPLHAPDEKGEYRSVDLALSALCRLGFNITITPDGWGAPQDREMITHYLSYPGLLPPDARLLVVGRFLIKRIEPFESQGAEPLYAVKPITHLSREERAAGLFVSAAALQKELAAKRLQQKELPEGESSGFEGGRK